MSDIPDDIIEAARVLNMQLHSATELGQRTQWIAEALLAERARCAEIALVASCVENGDARRILEDVADAIKGEPT